MTRTSSLALPEIFSGLSGPLDLVVMNQYVLIQNIKFCCGLEETFWHYLSQCLETTNHRRKFHNLTLNKNCDLWSLIYFLISSNRGRSLTKSLQMRLIYVVTYLGNIYIISLNVGCTPPNSAYITSSTRRSFNRPYATTFYWSYLNIKCYTI